MKAWASILALSADSAGRTTTYEAGVEAARCDTLTFDDHVNLVSKSAFYHIRAMRHIRSALTEDMA